MLKLATTLVTVEVVWVAPAMTPGTSFMKSTMLRPFRATSRSCLLVTRSERSADSVCTCSRPTSASTVTVSETLPTSSMKSPTLMADFVVRMTLLLAADLNPLSSALTS